MAGAPVWVRVSADRIVASDPGLNRCRGGVSAAVAMASALAVEYGFAALTGAGAEGTVIAMLLGTIVAMMGSMALTGSRVWPKVRTAVFFPVAIGAGLLAGTATASDTDLMLGVFVVVMFVAVFVRRFGMAYFFYGFLGWLGYFFASFLHATLGAFPSLMAAVGVGTAWILLLSVTVLRTNANRTLRRTRRAFSARRRSVLRACALLLDDAREPDAASRAPRRVRRVHAAQTRMAESALMIEGWLGDDSALPEGWSAPAVRRRVLDLQLAVDTLAAAAEALAEAVRAGPPGGGEATLAAETIRHLGRGEDGAARRAVSRLADAATASAMAGDRGWWPARRLADAVVELLGLTGPPDAARAPVGAREDAKEFEPAVTLAMGNLPGSAVAATGVAARGARWNPLARLSMTTRQAMQVALAGGLAIVVGRELSERRYYWAVIAAFVMFTGTATRSETVIKGFNRVLGTLVGLFAGVALAHVTAGHTVAMLAVIVLSMSLGFYLVRISYAFMIFFVTIMVSQLYSALHEFSDGLLLLRLEETAIGAAIGMAVALLFVPLSTRDTVGSARSAMLTALSDLMNAVADRIEGRVPAVEEGEERPRDLDGLARAVDSRFQQLTLVAKPLTRPLPLRGSPRLGNRMLAGYGGCAVQARRMVAALRRNAEPPPARLAVAARGLAEEAAGLAAEGPGDGAASARSASVDAVLFTRPPAAGVTIRHPVTRPLIHLRQLLRELVVPPGSREPGPVPEAGTTPAAAVLSGQVATSAGEPVESGVVLVTGPDGSRRGRARFTGGRYRIETRTGGESLVIVTAPGYEPVSERVRVREGEWTRADFRVRPVPRAPATATGSVRGTVRGPGDVGPLPGASVTVLDGDGTVLAGTTTDATGGYCLPALPRGTYTVVAAGFVPAVRSARLRPGRTCRADLTLRGTSAAAPRGRR